ncbi:hypothetical protein TIFTF001_044672 [Ficus carica]|uniref:Putative plant transposon protein domain-containing protein n=1 Tax=Ficus carica TaxID=3494 RepID=A0AA87ZFS5_FICCA|nr:hypothetical protein TIFTF001_044670 [Ficus carica]GMN32313.1 hypothetical protein TIFTF001_044672 [Ficus carica]
MPVKKRAMRGKGKAAAVNVGVPLVAKFESELARKRFNDSFAERNLWPERGFAYMSSNTLGYPEYIYSVIFKNNWKNFCQHPSAAIVPLVREVYANFDVGNPNSVYVRGKRVDISGAAINNVYSLNDVEDEYIEFSKRVHENQLSEIVKEICVPGTEWIKSARGSRSLSRCNLKPGPLIWNHFLKSRLMPSTHDNTVNKDRVILLFAIVMGRKINVGDVINEQIGVCAGRQSGGLWFPSLITSLCLAQGVEISSEEEKPKVAQPITMTVITRLLHDKPAIATAKNPSPVPEACPPEHSNRASFDAGSSLFQLEQRISQMEVMQYESLQMMRDFWKYERDKDLALQKHFRSNSKRFQSFPKFPQHLCDSSAEDSEPERDVTPEAVSSSHSMDEAHDVPTTAPTTVRDKGKNSMAKSVDKKSILRSAANWKWKH